MNKYVYRLMLLVGSIGVATIANAAQADTPCDFAGLDCAAPGTRVATGTAKPARRGFNITKYRFDNGHAITGWRVNESWYVGRYKGGVSKFALVREAGTTQFSIGHRGIAVNLQF